MLFSQENALKTIGGAAKKKVEAQDFNTTRNNRENLNSNKKASKSSEAPAAAPPPAPADSAQGTGTTYDSKYTFTASFVYLIEGEQGKSESQSITYYIGENVFKANVNSEMSMIMDSKNNAMISISEESKTAVVMSLDRMNAMTTQPTKETEKSEITLTKTGRTKQILGYTCEEYVSVSKEGKTIYWIAPNTGVNLSESFISLMSKQTNASQSMNTGGGLLMEMTSLDSSNKQKSHLLMTSLNKEVQQFFLGAYKITSL